MTRFALSTLALLLAGLAAGTPPVYASHGQGYPCYQCHSLQPSVARTGSRAIRTDQPVLATIPPSGAAWTGGNPVSCDFCHRAASDVPTAAFGTRPRKHPVDLIQTGDNSANPREITCNDCHYGKNGGPVPDNADVAPLSLLAPGGTALGYGYPDHINVSGGYSHDLAANPPHLGLPYWGATLPGLDRSNDTAFWAGVLGGTQDMTCWGCHAAGRQSPFTRVTSSKAVRDDYTGSAGGTKGHPVRSSIPGAIGRGAALPCYDCHNSHGSVNNAFILDNQSIYGPGASTLATTGYYQSARPYADRVVCAGCHDTGKAATAAGARVEGLDPVDPFDSTGTRSIHSAGGVADNMLASTRNCLAANNGCHTNAHDPSVPCVMCHAPSGSGPTVVWPLGNRPDPPAGVTGAAYGSHLVARKTDNVTTATDWTVQCNRCHSGHAGPVRVPLPPASWNNNNGNAGLDMRTVLGIDYAGTGGIHLGGTDTLGTTEAELCWSCHDSASNGVSEFGFNTSTAPPGYPVVWQTFPTRHDGTSQRFDFGWIYTDNGHTTRTSDWTAGWWSDEYDPKLNRRIASVHSASFDPAGQSSSVMANVDDNGVVNRTSPVLEGKQFIRCSYCHDVHDLNRANGSVFGAGYGKDNTVGKPWLRGRWVSNPYPPELPPRSAYYNAGGYTSAINTYTGTPTPRALSTSRDRGGYFIDQNSGRPTDNAASSTLPQTAELCVLCHGPNVDTMKFYPASKLWLPGMVNGHSNAALGGTRANRRNLFNGLRPITPVFANYGMGIQAGGVGLTTGLYNCGYYGGECDASVYPQSWSMNGICSSGSGDCWFQYIVNSGWYGGAAGTFTPYGGDYAGWYGDNAIGGFPVAGAMAHKFTCSKCHSPHATGLPVLLTHNCIDTALAEPAPFAPSNPMANNCHRKTTKSDGWHRLSPGQ